MSGSKYHDKKKTLDLTGYYNNRSTTGDVDTKAELKSVPIANSTGKISTALGGLFSATAGPLLPTNIAFKSFNKMWRSQSSEDFSKTDSTSSAASSPKKEAAVNNNAVNGKEKNLKKNLLRKMPSFDLEEVTNKIPRFGDIYGGRRRHSLTSVVLDDSHLPEAKLINDSNGPRKDPEDGEENQGNVFNNATFSRDDSFPKPLIFRPSFDAGDENAAEDISPAYEDTNDLESSISKLRELLENKQRHSSSEDDCVGSIGAIAVKTSNKKRSLLEVQDLPLDGSLILNVSIPSVESMTSLMSSSSQETFDLHQHQPNSLDGFEESFPPLYCVAYDGIYLECIDGNSYRYVSRSRKVKRRFKEFLNLHLRLEENPKLKAQLRGLKGPNKWLHLPFTHNAVKSNLAQISEQSLEGRRAFLQKWLIKLAQIPAVVVSKEFMAFMAYGDDGSAAFREKSSENSDSKIDRKFLSRTVFGVIHSIKDALPTFEDAADGSNLNENDAAEETSTNSSSLNHNGFHFPAMLLPNRSTLTSQTSSNSNSISPISIPDGIFGKKSSGNYKIGLKYSPSLNLGEFEQTAEFFSQHFDQKIKNSRRNSAKLEQEEEKEQKLIDKLKEARIHSRPELSDVITEFATLILRRIDDFEFVDREFCVSLLKSTCVKVIDDSLDRLIKVNSSEEAWIGWLKIIRNVVFDPGESEKLPEIAEEKLTASQIERINGKW